MTEELREDLVHLSVPKFIDFFLSRPEFGGLNHACEVLELLSNMFQVSPLIDIQVLRS
jgi:hypothetical protein